MIRALPPLLALVLALLATAGDGAAAETRNGARFEAGGPDLARFTNTNGAFLRADRSNWWLPQFAVDAFSRLDEILPSNPVRRPGMAIPWRRPEREPAFGYTVPAQFGGGNGSVDGYLSRHPATGLLVAVGDTIHIERYQYGRTDAHRFTSFSMAKTVCALLVGLAVADGVIRSIDDPAERYAPALAGSEYGRTPIRHLLTMSSGVKFREEYDGHDDVSRLSRAVTGGGAGGPQAVLQFNQRYAPPGQRWYYASAETHVLGLVLRGATGRSVADYLAERIWQPIGAEADASWITDATGQEAAYGYINATLRDYARLGMLLANGGRAGDRQIVPPGWLHEMTKAHFSGQQTGRWFGYGFQTWVFPENDGSFALLGVRGQAIYIDPSRRLVMVHTAVRAGARDPGSAETTALWRGLRQHFPRHPE